MKFNIFPGKQCIKSFYNSIPGTFGIRTPQIVYTKPSISEAQNDYIFYKFGGRHGPFGPPLATPMLWPFPRKCSA